MNVFPVDPKQIIQLIKNGYNPQQLMLTILEGQAGTPMGANLLKLAREGKTAEIEQLARNLSKESGIDFDAEFERFRQQLGL